MKQFTVLCVILIIKCCFMENTEGTKCRPLSKFRIDCNICECGQNGQSYFCTQNRCLPPDIKDEFVAERNELGYLILTPKKQQNPVSSSYLKQQLNEGEDSMIPISEENFNNIAIAGIEDVDAGNDAVFIENYDIGTSNNEKIK